MMLADEPPTALDSAGVLGRHGAAEQVAVVQQVRVVDAFLRMPAVNDVAVHVDEVGVLAAPRGGKTACSPVGKPPECSESTPPDDESTSPLRNPPKPMMADYSRAAKCNTAAHSAMDYTGNAVTQSPARRQEETLCSKPESIPNWNRKT